MHRWECLVQDDNDPPEVDDDSNNKPAPKMTAKQLFGEILDEIDSVPPNLRSALKNAISPADTGRKARLRSAFEEINDE